MAWKPYRQWILGMARPAKQVVAVPHAEIPVRAAITDLHLHDDLVWVGLRAWHVHDLVVARAGDL
jgi:hypothetical protein